MAPGCRQQISTASDFRRRGETRSRGSALVRDSGRRGRVLIHSGVASGHRDHLGGKSVHRILRTRTLAVHAIFALVTTLLVALDIVAAAVAIASPEIISAQVS